MQAKQRIVGALLAAAVTGATAGLAAGAASAAAGPPGSTPHFSTATPLSQSSPVVDAHGRPLAVAYETPAGSSVSVTLDASQQEQYWYWASGVKLTATGLEPGEPVTITDTSPSGAVFTFDPAKADSSGGVAAVLKSLDYSAEVGHHLITVEGSTSHLLGTADLTVLPDPNKTLRVTTSPSRLTQDEFYDKPVTVRATGLSPNQRVYFNLFAPDGTGMAVGADDYLHANSVGVFTYTFQATSVSTAAGLWTASIIGYGDSQSGSATYEIAPGGPRTATGALTVDHVSVTADAFAQAGETYTLDGVDAFQAYELTLTTPYGAVVDLGAGRANGDGHAVNTVTGTSGVPLGVYELRATSLTSGDYAVTRFTVTDSAGAFPAPPEFTGPDVISTTALTDPSGGLRVSGTDLSPGTAYIFALRDSLGTLIPLRAGQTAVANADADGALSVTLSTRAKVEPGSYHVQITAGVPQTAREVPVTVTGDVSSAAPARGAAASKATGHEKSSTAKKAAVKKKTAAAKNAARHNEGHRS